MSFTEQGRGIVNALWEPCSLTSAITSRITRQYLDNDLSFTVHNEGRFSLSFIRATRHAFADTILKLGEYLPVQKCHYQLNLYPPERTAWVLRNGSAHSEGSCDYGNNAIYIMLFSTGMVFDFSHIEEIRQSLSHETHHLIRDRKTVGGTRLFERLVTEGLAIHFSNEIEEKTGLPAKYAREDSITVDDVLRLRSMARNEYFETKSYKRWFTWGDYLDRIPGGTGYVLGYEIVKDYLERNPKARPSSLVGTPAEDFFTSEDLRH